ncbi:MAG: DoxX family protein [Planctomycetes bacterium]|nr:DoxX family protein [Planctomycetota bacterium]
MILQHKNSGWMWAIFTTRWVLGLIFFIAGWWKCFEMTPKGHAEQFFIGQFDSTWIPHWLLWAIGTSIPVLELLAGLLVCLGLLRIVAYVTLGAILVTVTYGHLLLEPLYDTTGHIFPRLVLLVFVLVAPRAYDVLSLDYLIAYIRKRSDHAPPSIDKNQS